MVLTVIIIPLTAEITNTHNKTKESKLKTAIQLIKAIKETAIEIIVKIGSSINCFFLFSLRVSVWLSLKL